MDYGVPTKWSEMLEHIAQVIDDAIEGIELVDSLDVSAGEVETQKRKAFMAMIGELEICRQVMNSQGIDRWRDQTTYFIGIFAAVGWKSIEDLQKLKAFLNDFKEHYDRARSMSA